MRTDSELLGQRGSGEFLRDAQDGAAQSTTPAHAGIGSQRKMKTQDGLPIQV
jgi:hypothetical protein